MTLIGFLGKKHRGKDTCCDYIVEKYGYKSNSFAGPLKRGIQEWFGFSDNQLFTELKEEIDENWGISPRKAFQLIGTELGRNIIPKLLPNLNTSFWIKSFDIWYEKNKNLDIVVSDVRFQDEVDYIRSKGGIIIKITRKECDEYEIVETDLHKSEIEIDKIKNYTLGIDNDGNLNDLYLKLDDIVTVFSYSD